MNGDYETRKLPLPPNHDAIDHIMRAVDCVLAWRSDPYFEPTRTDISRLANVCAALAYAGAIAAHVKNELEARLAGDGDELHRLRERYGESERV
jgi:hypothetical protein